MSDPAQLSKRERQIMDILYAAREGTATVVLAGLPDPPSRTAVRTLLTILERKGHLTHRKVGREFVYRPARGHAQAARTALRRVLKTFFAGSLEGAVVAGLADPSAKPTDEELARIAALIEQAKRDRRV
jgi:BlaI family penicillinase repressor